jgi:hypothetical protein
LHSKFLTLRFGFRKKTGTDHSSIETARALHHLRGINVRLVLSKRKAGKVSPVSPFSVSAIPAFAHHSFAMFDAENKVTLEATVKEFQWTNPHSWILMTVSNAESQAEQWAIEMGGHGFRDFRRD